MEREVKYTLRLPESIHKELEAMAKKNRRSLNNELLIIFEEVIEKRALQNVEACQNLEQRTYNEP